MRCKKIYELFSLTLALYLLLAALGFSSSQAAPVKKTKKPVAVKTSVNYAPLTLHDYISQVCSIHCVEQEELLSSVSQAAKRTGTDVRTLLTIISIESRFNVRAKNGSSVGLHQVHLRWHRQKFTDKNYYDVGQNVAAGATVYGDCFKKHNGNRNQALRCYNGYGHGDPNYLVKFNKVYAIIARLVDLQREPTGETRTTSSDPKALAVVLDNSLDDKPF